MKQRLCSKFHSKSKVKQSLS